MWDGSSWTITPSPNGTSFDGLDAVSCTSAVWCVAVGGTTSGPTFPALSELWDGTAWTIGPAAVNAVDGTLQSVSCTGTTFCFALLQIHGSSSTAEVWDGSRWTVVANPPPNASDLLGASCVNPMWCMAVGDEGGYEVMYHWDGSSWSRTSTRVVKVYLGGVDCLSATKCFAVGEHFTGSNHNNFFSYGHIEHWNGTTWTAYKPPAWDGVIYHDLNSVSCVSSKVCLTVGDEANRDLNYGPWALKST
jgi:hypothetical protein